ILTKTQHRKDLSRRRREERLSQYTKMRNDQKAVLKNNPCSFRISLKGLPGLLFSKVPVTQTGYLHQGSQRLSEFICFYMLFNLVILLLYQDMQFRITESSDTTDPTLIIFMHQDHDPVYKITCNSH